MLILNSNAPNLLYSSIALGVVEKHGLYVNILKKKEKRWILWQKEK